jgi:rhodanese-related sulfurtransferase
MDRGDNFKLVMTMDDYAYERMHIPGSLHFSNALEAMKQLRPDGEVVVYCSTKWCHDSINAILCCATMASRSYPIMWVG